MIDYCRHWDIWRFDRDSVFQVRTYNWFWGHIEEILNAYQRYQKGDLKNNSKYDDGFHNFWICQFDFWCLVWHVVPWNNFKNICDQFMIYDKSCQNKAKQSWCCHWWVNEWMVQLLQPPVTSVSSFLGAQTRLYSMWLLLLTYLKPDIIEVIVTIKVPIKTNG